MRKEIMSLRDELIGTWSLVSNVNLRDGVESHPFGQNALGQLMLDARGRCSVLMFERDLPRFAAGKRTAGTEEENRRIVHGCLNVFGTWELLEPESTLVLLATASTYPNLVGVPMRRPFRLEQDEQVWQVMEATVGGSSRITWKRVGA
jgi:hypothetical protein